jgi:hypothetical protein
MPNDPKKPSTSDYLVGAAIVGLAIWLLWWLVGPPDTRKMSDEQYMLWQIENNRQYP